MEKCAKVIVDAAGQVTSIVGEISCQPQTVTSYPYWFIFGTLGTLGLILALIAWGQLIHRKAIYKLAKRDKVETEI